MKKGFLLKNIYSKQWKILSTLQKGILIEAIFEYEENGTVPIFDSEKLEMAWSFIEEDLKENDISYRKIVERNKINGSKGGRPQKINKPSEENQEESFLEYKNYLKFISDKKSQNILVVEAIARKKYLSQKCDFNTLKKIMSEWDKNSEWLKNTCNWTSFLDFDFLQRISSGEFFEKEKVLSERDVKILIADRTDIEFSKKLELTRKFENKEITQEEALNGT